MIAKKPNLRLISRLDIKSESVVKGINLEGIRKVGNPNILANQYYEDGIDEIIYMDVVASLYDRNSLTDFIREVSANIFVPITVGGGIRTLHDIKSVLNNGADKVAINTAAIKNPGFIYDAAQEVGSQAIVVSIEAKKRKNLLWEAYYDNGREPSGKNVLDWIQEVDHLGAGEIFLTSVDKEGMQKGIDIELLIKARKKTKLPIIYSGGVGNINHINEAVPYADAVAVASILHYKKSSVKEIKTELKSNNIIIR